MTCESAKRNRPAAPLPFVFLNPFRKKLQHSCFDAGRNRFVFFFFLLNFHAVFQKVPWAIEILSDACAKMTIKFDMPPVVGNFFIPTYYNTFAKFVLSVVGDDDVRFEN